jgi:hypothetical protein
MTWMPTPQFLMLVAAVMLVANLVGLAVVLVALGMSG